VGPNHKSKGLKGRPAGPTPWLVGHTLSRFMPRLDGYIHTSVHKSILCPRVGGNWEEWVANHVDGRSAIHHLHTDSIKSVEAPLYLYIRILTRSDLWPGGKHSLRVPYRPGFNPRLLCTSLREAAEWCPLV
jgi:hypothetical protein